MSKYNPDLDVAVFEYDPIDTDGTTVIIPSLRRYGDGELKLSLDRIAKADDAHRRLGRLTMPEVAALFEVLGTALDEAPEDDEDDDSV